MPQPLAVKHCKCHIDTYHLALLAVILFTAMLTVLLPAHYDVFLTSMWQRSKENVCDDNQSSGSKHKHYYVSLLKAPHLMDYGGRRQRRRGIAGKSRKCSNAFAAVHEVISKFRA